MIFGVSVDEVSGDGNSLVAGERCSPLGTDFICFFLSCSAFIRRAFSGVIVGDFGGFAIVAVRMGVLELVEGRPPLV